MAHVVYTLKLSENKYYVGKTNNIKQRLVEHTTGQACAWTSRYPAEALISTVLGDGWTEEKVTLLMMKQHGVENVRGGSYSKIELSKLEKAKALQQIASVSDTCYICGSSAHFASSCRRKTASSSLANTRKNNEAFKKKPVCSRCGRTGHNVRSCYAKTHIDDSLLPDTQTDPSCSRCGRTGHNVRACYAKTHIDKSLLPDTQTEPSCSLM